MTLLDTALVAALAAVLAYRQGWTVGARKMSRAVGGQSTVGAFKRWASRTWEDKWAPKDPSVCPGCGQVHAAAPAPSVPSTDALHTPRETSYL